MERVQGFLQLFLLLLTLSVGAQPCAHQNHELNGYLAR